MEDLTKTFIIELKNHNYARNTIKAYSKHVQHFLEYSAHNPREPEERIRMFLDVCSDSFEQKRIAFYAIYSTFLEFVIFYHCVSVLISAFL